MQFSLQMLKRIQLLQSEKDDNLTVIIELERDIKRYKDENLRLSDENAKLSEEACKLREEVEVYRCFLVKKNNLSGINLWRS